MPLTEQEIEIYRRDGLVIPAGYRLPEATLARIDALYRKLLDDNRDSPDFSADFILGPHLDTDGTYGVKGDPEWLEFAQIPEILDMVEQLIGPDFILWGMTIFGKPARIGKATPWHQDGDYYPRTGLHEIYSRFASRSPHLLASFRASRRLHPGPGDRRGSGRPESSLRYRARARANFAA
jgi:hypothetical protein